MGPRASNQSVEAACDQRQAEGICQFVERVGNSRGQRSSSRKWNRSGQTTKPAGVGPHVPARPQRSELEADSQLGVPTSVVLFAASTEQGSDGRPLFSTD